jgi:hypothetical protein
MLIRLLFLGLCLLLSTTATASNTTVLQQARELLSHGEGQAAYELLLSQEGRLAGDPSYDVLLAQAALQSGQANIALFVLERVVFSHPELHQARLLMASAYIRLEAYPQAQELLEALLREEGVDAQTRRQAGQMLDGIRAHTRRTRISAYFGFGMGNDSNANAATASTTFLGYDLAANSIATPSATLAASLGAQAQYALVKRSMLFTGVDWAANQYPGATFVNNDVLGFQLGWQQNGKYVLAYQAQTVNVEGALNNRGNHIYGLMKTDSRMAWRPFLRLGEVRYGAGLSIKDVTQAIIGTQFSLSDWIRGTRMSILVAEDMPIEAGSPYGRSYSGLQIHSESRYLNRVTVAFKAGVLYSQYHGLFFGERRDERQSNIGLDVHYRAARTWDCSLYAGLTNSWSTLALYQYDRLIVGLNIKRRFVR